eukprot:GHVU01062658.1.p1 GENE.GHVU01062658.1~~GHVU01062658.1.p1  ORF type:complete len:142 (-),score=4.10 GHVU01062658.1:51-476(-)
MRNLPGNLLLAGLAVILSVVLFTSGVESVKCYHCTYNQNIISGEQGESCNDPFRALPGITVPIKECDNGCSKNVVKFTDDFINIDRGCVITKAQCVGGGDTFGLHCCDSSLCNAATNLRLPGVFTLITSSLAVTLLLITRL